MPQLALRKTAFAALALSLCLSVPASAAPVAVEFLPPEIEAQEICTPKRADPDLLGRWQAWDGVTLPEGDPELVVQDARRLRDLNPTGNFELVDKMLTVAELMPAQKVPNTDIDRINLYLKAGKVPQLRELGLIAGMEANDATLAPKALNLLATLYIDGMVVKKDKDRGLALLTRAAMGGNADALFRLAGMNLNGEAVPGWDLDPSLAVTMAFGALVGKLDPEICDRIGRIAREYSSGEVVQQNYAISEQWLRLAADLGDANAAWKVAELHLESELIEKNNDTLLKYMTLAADRGVATAQVELGKLYEAGALLAPDPAKAEALYAEAAEAGNRNALFRLATILEPRIADPEIAASYRGALIKVTEMAQAPGWAFSKLAKLILEQKGRWAGEAEALPLLEKGVALEDADAAQDLAYILLRQRDKKGIFERATELLGFSISNAGKIDPMTDLRHAYLCRAPKGADLRLADFWRHTEEAAGSSTEFLSQDDIAALDPKKDPLAIARLQTHALYGRPNSVAYYLEYLTRNNAAPEVMAFWRARVDPVPATVDAVARQALVTPTPTAEAIETTLAALQRARADGLPRAPVDLAAVLLDYFPGDAQKEAEAIGYLREAAAQGSGEALLRLSPLLLKSGIGNADLLAQYAEVINARGDADALIFAATVTRDNDLRRDYLYRAASVVDCVFDAAIKLAGAFIATEDDAETEHWLEVSSQLAGEDGWRHVAVADRYMAMGGQDRAKIAIALYEEGVGLGDDTAVSRLVRIYADPDNLDYAPTKAVAMFKRMIEQAPAANLASIRAKVLKAPTTIRTALMQEVDWEAHYQAAAATGDPIAMRELALYLRENGTTLADAQGASDWFKRAAEGGDAIAMVELAKAYAMGLGLAPSIQQATLLLKDAASMGNPEAQRLLATMSTGNQEN